jgi:hypothetical protein
MNEMDAFLHSANLESFRKQLACTTDEVGRQMLLRLLEIEQNKDNPPHSMAA